MLRSHSSWLERGSCTWPATRLSQGIGFHNSSDHQLLDSAGFASLLRSCADAQALSDGLLVHHHIVKSGLEENSLLRNLLIKLYGECGSIDAVRALFARMHQPDKFAWNFMIKSYAKQGRMEEALLLLDQMHHEGLCPDKFIYVTILSGCSSPLSISAGKQLHAILAFTSNLMDGVMGTALVNMYGKCRDFSNAQKVFDSLADRDVVSWNTMIAVYDHLGQSQDAIRLFAEMQRSGTVADKYTFVCVLSACASQAALLEGRLLHSCIAGCDLELNEAAGSVIVHMYCKCGCLEDARKTFDEMLAPSLLSWTAMMAGYAQYGQCKDALQLLAQMQSEGLLPDKIAFLALVSNLTSLKEGKRLHVCIISNNLKSDAVMMNALVDMYVACDSLQDARHTFDQMFTKDVAAWTAMIGAYAHSGEESYAFELFEQMQVEGVLWDLVVFVNILSACTRQVDLNVGKRIHACIISCGFVQQVSIGNAVINMYRNCGSLEDALSMFLKMDLWDEVTFISTLSTCACHSALRAGKLLHICILVSGLGLDMLVSSALLTMYSRCGSLADARAIFGWIPQRNLSVWNAMIGAYSENGEGKSAIHCFEIMQQSGMTPNAVTFVSVFSACSHAGFVDEGFKYFRSMVHAYGIAPEVDHYNCMVNLLGRVGQLDVIENFIKIMPLPPTSVTWITLLESCRKQLDLERGEYAAEKALELDAGNTAAYVILANIYTRLGRDGDAVKLMERMKAVVSSPRAGV